jgi:hypothetical protein
MPPPSLPLPRPWLHRLRNRLPGLGHRLRCYYGEGLTSRIRASPATAPHLPGADRRQGIVDRTRDRPVYRTGTIHTCQGRRLSRVERALALTRPFVWPCAIRTASAPWTTVLLRLSGWRIRTPPTLPRCPRGQRRTARGRCESPLLHRRDLHHLLTVGLPGTLTISRPWVAGRLTTVALWSPGR